MRDQEALKELEDGIIEEIQADIIALADEPQARLCEIQPPTSICRLAAVAAAQVLMAFERGYRMDIAPEELPSVAQEQDAEMAFERGYRMDSAPEELPSVAQEQDAEMAVADDSSGLPGIDHPQTFADWF